MPRPTLSGLLCVMMAGGVGAVTPRALVAQSGLDSIYDRLRAIERSFPRVASEDVVIGTLDAATGKFFGKVSTPDSQATECVTDRTGKHPNCGTFGQKKAPIIVARARIVRLVFNVRNRGSASFSVTANGTSASAPAGATSVAVPITGVPDPAVTDGSRWRIQWTASSGGSRYTDSLLVDRMSFGAGAFTIPVFPVAIIYDLPQDQNHQSVATFKTSQTSGSAATLTLSTANGISQEAETRFEDMKKFSEGTHDIGFVLDTVGTITGNVELAAVGKALEGISKAFVQAFGQASGTGNQIDSRVDATTHRLSITTSQSFATGRLGPGKGDVFVFLKDLRIGWLSRCCAPLSVVPLGASALGAPTAAALLQDLDSIRTRRFRIGPHSKLDSLSIQGLLALDPFVKGGEHAPLPADRFDSLTPSIIVPGTPLTRDSKVTEASLEQHTSIRTSETVEKDSTGLLSTILGIGPQANATITTTITQTNLTELAGEGTRELSITIGGPGIDTLVVNPFYDRLFGTIAVRPIVWSDQVSGDLTADSTSSTASPQVAQSSTGGAGAVAPVGSNAPRSVTKVATPAGTATATGRVFRPLTTRASASPVAYRPVTLTIQGHAFATSTDARGHYVFRIPHYATSVPATIAVEGDPRLGLAGMSQQLVLSARTIIAPPFRVR